MIFDILVCAVLVISIFVGYRNGFVRTFLHMAGWILSLVAAFFFTPQLKAFFTNQLPVYSMVETKISAGITDELLDVQRMYGNLPASISKGLDSMTMDLAQSVTENLSGLVLSLISFFVIVLAVKLASYLVASLFSKRHNSGLTGFVDGTLGLTLGFIKGAFLVFVLLGLLIPVLSLCEPTTASAIMGDLNQSRLAKDLYDNNLILLILQDVLW